jgi:hypothetical protein
MHVTIFDKLRPFSHVPGTSYVLPGTNLVFTLYPTVIQWHELSEPKNIMQLQLNITGPVKDFTSQLDLEKGFIQVWGRANEGYFKYRICSHQGSFALTKLKEPATGLNITGDHNEEGEPQTPIRQERLHLGVSKKQDWEMTHRRRDLKELLPFWYALSQQVPASHCEESPSLYTNCKELIAKKATEQIGSAFESLYMSAFSGVFVPRFHDDDYHGFTLPPFAASSPMAIISAGGQLIRSLFTTIDRETLHILPALPVEFHSGRFIQVKAGDYGEMDIEWTKKSLRRLVFRCEKEGDLQFVFQKHLCRYRLRDINDRKGEVIACGSPFHFCAGKTYLFDNFQK